MIRMDVQSLSKHVGGFLLMADMSMAKDMTLRTDGNQSSNFVSQALLDENERDLAEVK